jgi:acetylornithine deacetylase/succinyl-diaminopimelate desuccinylase-like protein
VPVPNLFREGAKGGVTNFSCKIGYFLLTLYFKISQKMSNIKTYVNDNKDRFINELIDLLKIPSVSADPKYAADVRRCAEAVKKSLLDAGVDSAEICETKGHPIVYGEKMIDPSKPTVLVYGHYDVQPADPLELWDSPPFEPVIKKTAVHPDGAIFARGACDDKGQMYMHVKAFELMIKTNSLCHAT